MLALGRDEYNKRRNADLTYVVHGENNALISFFIFRCCLPSRSVSTENHEDKKEMKKVIVLDLVLLKRTQKPLKNTRTHNKEQSKKNERNSEQAFQRESVHFTLFYEVHKRHEVSFQRQWFCFFFAFLFISFQLNASSRGARGKGDSETERIFAFFT